MFKMFDATGSARAFLITGPGHPHTRAPAGAVGRSVQIQSVLNEFGGRASCVGRTSHALRDNIDVCAREINTRAHALRAPVGLFPSK